MYIFEIMRKDVVLKQLVGNESTNFNKREAATKRKVKLKSNELNNQNIFFYRKEK